MSVNSWPAGSTLPCRRANQAPYCWLSPWNFMPQESMPEAMKCASPPLKVHMLGSQSASDEVSPPGTPVYRFQLDGALLPVNSWVYLRV
jgi:hypothetical protein